MLNYNKYNEETQGMLLGHFFRPLESKGNPKPDSANANSPVPPPTFRKPHNLRKIPYIMVDVRV